jgi:hypothetical protein
MRWRYVWVLAAANSAPMRCTVLQTDTTSCDSFLEVATVAAAAITAAYFDALSSSHLAAFSPTAHATPTPLPDAVVLPTPHTATPALGTVAEQ